MFKSIKGYILFFILFCVLLSSSCNQKNNNKLSPDILVIGGGASGITAGITSSRLGVETVIIEETSWLGGMLTSAGVSAVDGNFNLPSGFFGEFRDSLANYYGGLDKLNTGWVSSVLFEPSVGNEILNNIASNEPNLKIEFNSKLKSIKKDDSGWIVEIKLPDGVKTYYPKVVIDATELGDVAKACGVSYDIGMDSRNNTGEEIAAETPNNIIQDLTYVAILKDYGHDVTIPRPANYDSTQYFCSCINPLCTDPKEIHRMWPKENMITYGKLPNNKYMINWPIEGNDFYLNIIENTPEEREEQLKQAKEFTLGFVYFIQTELGMNTLGIADDEFPTSDGLPMIPYHRESRRIKGVVQFNVNDITKPYDQKQKLYRTTIAVGDYPVDHHHARYHDWENLPDLHFHPVPSYGLPLGVLIPKDVNDLIVAEKSISVTNIVNGTTRLQPVVVQIGQAAGILASLSIIDNKPISEVSVRDVQSVILNNGGYLLPYLDVPKNDKLFLSLQRIGSTGIMKGVGRNEGWSNQTWFRAKDSLLFSELEGLKELYPNVVFPNEGYVTIQQALDIVNKIIDNPDVNINSVISGIYNQYEFGELDLNRTITRAEMAVIIDHILNPFEKPVDIYGAFS